MLTQEDLMAIATLMDKKLEPIKEQLKELEPIKERLDGMDKRLDGMDEQLKVLDKKNTDTRSVIETQIEHAIRLLAEGHAQIVESMVKPAQLEEVHPRLDTLENVVSVHSKEIRELQQKIG